MNAGIGLGSNLGDRLAHLRQARDLLREASGVTALRQSPLYETAPVDCPPGSAPFLNAVIELSTTTSPRALFNTLAAIERQLGRIRTAIRNSPRVVDLDLLYFEDIELSEPDLVIPHPRLAQRRFVLAPLSVLCPNRVIPGTGTTVQALLDGLPGDTDTARLWRNDW
jgi:2-amino-4-hydroxy-6-hydroxymethyldihydropteridine diphosphokinase